MKKIILIHPAVKNKYSLIIRLVAKTRMLWDGSKLVSAMATQEKFSSTENRHVLKMIKNERAHYFARNHFIPSK